MFDSLEKGIKAFRQDYFKGQKVLVKVLEEWYAKGAAGTNLSPYVPQLIPILKESTTINVMKPVANLLALAAIKSGDFSPLKPLLEKKQFCTYIVDGFEFADEAGHDIKKSFPYLFSFLHSDWSGSDRLKYLVGKHIERHPQQLSPLVDILLEKEKWHFFISAFLKEIALWRGLDISSVLTSITPILRHEKRRVRREIAALFKIAAEGDANFSEVEASLRQAFDDDFEIVAQRCAYALAWSFLRTGDDEKFLGLYQDSRLPVAYGAFLALTTHFVSQKRNDEMTIMLIIEALLCPEPKMKKRALEAFDRARERQVHYRFSKAHLQLLVKEDNGLSGGLDFLMTYVDDDKKRAKEVEAILSKESSPLALEVSKQCQLLLAGESPLLCAFCQDMAKPNLHRVFSAGKNFKPTIKKDQEVDNKLVVCTNCGAWYCWSFYLEYDVNSCREDWTLTPLAPTEVRQKIDYEKTIRSMEQRLTGCHPFERKRAAWALVHHFVYTKELSEIAHKLLQHQDLAVREKALATMLALWSKGLEKLAKKSEYGPLQKAVEKQLSVDEEGVAKLAAKLQTNYLLLKKENEAINELLQSDSGPVVEGAVLALWQVFDMGKSLAPYDSSLFALRTHSNERVARWARVCTDEKLRFKKHFPILLQELGSDDEVVRRYALRSLGKVIKKGCRAKNLMKEALQEATKMLTQQEMAATANETIRAAIKKRWDVSFAFLPLSELLQKKWFTSKWDFFWTLNEALTAGADLTEIFPNIALVLAEENCQSSAVPFLRDGQKKGLSISAVVGDLERALDEIDDNYALEALTEMLTKEFFRAFDLRGLKKLGQEKYRRNWYSLCSHLEILLPNEKTKDLGDLWSERSDLTKRVSKLLNLTKVHFQTK